MSDRYLEVVNSGIIGKLAKQLGLPQPTPLKRMDKTSLTGPLVTGPVVVLGKGKAADELAESLLTWEVDVRRSAPPAGPRIAAIIAVLTDLEDPGQMSPVALEIGGLLRRLAKRGRVITLHRDPAGASAPAQAAARLGVDGFLRSVAKELRYGATGNGLVLADHVGLADDSVRNAIRFFLSPRSAFVSGQFLSITGDAGTSPVQWAHPLEGQVAVVTGAARGIGAAIAEVLHRDGAQIIGVDVPAAGEALAATMNKVGGVALQADITAANAGERIVDLARTKFGRLDIVVHNAGITRDKLLANMKPELWDSVIDVNVRAPLALNEAFFAAADELSPDGLHVVGVSSTSGIAGNRGQTNYGYSKAAVIGMVEATAASLPSPHTINAVAPGFIETEMTARIPLIQRQVARRVNSLQQGGLPVDVAETISFLASPGARGISGQVLRVCGQNLVGQ